MAVRTVRASKLRPDQNCHTLRSAEDGELKGKVTERLRSMGCMSTAERSSSLCNSVVGQAGERGEA